TSTGMSMCPSLLPLFPEMLGTLPLMSACVALPLVWAVAVIGVCLRSRESIHIPLPGRVWQERTHKLFGVRRRVMGNFRTLVFVVSLEGTLSPTVCRPTCSRHSPLGTQYPYKERGTYAVPLFGMRMYRHAKITPIRAAGTSLSLSPPIVQA